MSARFIVADVFDGLAQLDDNSIDLVLTSPPFLALRSYLPADHPDKGREIGSEGSPAAFLDTLLDVVEACDRVLAPHGSLVFELGDTYSGDTGGHAGGDNIGNARYGAPRVTGRKLRTGWPLDKSLCLIPQLFAASLAYGRNLLRPERETPRWRVRNVVAWCRPNPPVGCVDAETEALTLDGWRTIDQLADGDLIAAYDPRTDSCRFQPAKFVRWHRDGEPMVAIDKRVATSQRLTEDHRVWTRTRKTEPHVRLARDLTNDCETLLCAPFDDVPGNAPVTVERAALLGWYIAEGTPAGRRARIVQSATANPEKVAAIRGLIERDGCGVHESVYRRPVVRSGRGEGKPPYDDLVTFTIKGDLAEWLNLHHKRLPMQYATTWPERQARALFDALIDGDGHRRKNAEGVLFHQQDEQIIDAVQVLALRLGYRAIKSWQPTMRIWQLTLSRDTDRRSVRWTKVKTWEGEGVRRETYTGTVWCPQVETTFWLARRKGRTFVTGNSLGDKYRPATSYLTVACKSRDRYFDLDAVRTALADSPGNRYVRKVSEGDLDGRQNATDGIERETNKITKDYDPRESAGAPPLDYWVIPTHPYPGSHYATFPPDLCTRPIKSMCPERVCLTCGQPSRRVVESRYVSEPDDSTRDKKRPNESHIAGALDHPPEVGWEREHLTLGWSDCGHDNWRRGVTLDPFAGSGTTGAVATGLGRDAVLIDLDERNAWLARERIGMFLKIELPDGDPETVT